MGGACSYPALVLCYRDLIQTGAGRTARDFHVLLVNDAQEINADCRRGDGEPWYFLVIVRKSRLYPAPAQWTAIFARHFGASWRKCQRRLLRYGGYLWNMNSRY